MKDLPVFTPANDNAKTEQTAGRSKMNRPVAFLGSLIALLAKQAALDALRASNDNQPNGPKGGEA